MDTKQLSHRIRQLALIEPNDSPVVSCYLNLDQPRSNPLLEIEERAELAAMTLRGQAKHDVRDALDQIRDWANENLKHNARGTAIFSRWGDEPFFIPMQFVRPLPNLLEVDDVPHIYPLVELKDVFHRFIIVLMREDEARIIETNIGKITEALVAERKDLRWRVGREWTREHYQNHRRDRNERFLKEKIRIIDDLVTNRKHTHIILGGNPNLVTRMRRALPKRLEEKVINTMIVDPTDGVSAIVREAIQVFVEQEQQESVANVKRLESAIRGSGLGVVGYPQVRQALEAGQADLLLIQQNLDDPEIREELTKLAIRSSVEIETVSNCPILEAFGGAGCLLRYLLPETVEEVRAA